MARPHNTMGLSSAFILLTLLYMIRDVNSSSKNIVIEQTIKITFDTNGNETPNVSMKVDGKEVNTQGGGTNITPATKSTTNTQSLDDKPLKSAVRSQGDSDKQKESDLKTGESEHSSAMKSTSITSENPDQSRLSANEGNARVQLTKSSNSVFGEDSSKFSSQLETVPATDKLKEVKESEKTSVSSENKTPASRANKDAEYVNLTTNTENEIKNKSLESADNKIKEVKEPEQSSTSSENKTPASSSHKEAESVNSTTNTENEIKNKSLEDANNKLKEVKEPDQSSTSSENKTPASSSHIEAESVNSTTNTENEIKNKTFDDVDISMPKSSPLLNVSPIPEPGNEEPKKESDNITSTTSKDKAKEDQNIPQEKSKGGDNFPKTEDTAENSVTNSSKDIKTDISEKNNDQNDLSGQKAKGPNSTPKSSTETKSPISTEGDKSGTTAENSLEEQAMNEKNEPSAPSKDVVKPGDIKTHDDEAEETNAGKKKSSDDSGDVF